MPKTSTGLTYRLRERDVPTTCLVCMSDGEAATIDVMMEIPQMSDQGSFAFPVCSLLCVMAWTEAISRCLGGDEVAVAMCLALMRLHRGE